MPTWIAILMGAGITLFVGIAAWFTLGIKLLERRETDVKWRTNVDADRKSFKKFMEQVGGTLKKIRKELDAVRQIMAARWGTPLFFSGSPLRLTDYGKKVSAEAGTEKWVKRVVPTLEGRVENMDA